MRIKRHSSNIKYNKKYVNKLTHVQTLAKKLYYDTSVTDNESNPKELWKYITSVIPRKRPGTTPVRALIVEGKAFDDSVDFCEQFNNHCDKIGQTISNSFDKILDSDFKLFLI